MKELLEECRKLDRDDLLFLFWSHYNERRFQEAYFIIHYMIFSNMNVDFLPRNTCDILRMEIE